MNKSVTMAYEGGKKISALRWRFIHHDGITSQDLAVGHFSILLTRLQAAKSILGLQKSSADTDLSVLPVPLYFTLQS